MKAILNGGPLDGGVADLPEEGVKKGSVLIVSAYCAAVHRFLDHEYVSQSRPKENKQQFQWKRQRN